MPSLRASFSNDWLNPFPLTALGGRRFHDDAFTCGLGLRFETAGTPLQKRSSLPPLTVDGAFLMFTEHGGMRRFDMLHVTAAWDYALEFAKGPTKLVAHAGAGPSGQVLGGLYGMHIQDAFHHVAEGRTLDAGTLQNVEPPGTTLGFGVNATLGLELQHRSELFSLTARANLQAEGVTQGINSIAAHAHAVATIQATPFLKLKLAADAAVVTARSQVPAPMSDFLNMNGGPNVRDWYFDPRLSIGAEHDRLAVEFEWRPNPFGVQAPIGTISVSASW